MTLRHARLGYVAAAVVGAGLVIAKALGRLEHPP